MFAYTVLCEVSSELSSILVASSPGPSSPGPWGGGAWVPLGRRGLGTPGEEGPGDEASSLVVATKLEK